MSKNNYCLQVDGDKRLRFFDTLQEALAGFLLVREDAVVFNRDGDDVVKREAGELTYIDSHKMTIHF